jgi:hypothetical protein
MNFSLHAKTPVRKSVAQKEESQTSSVTGKSVEGEPEKDETEESGRRDR